MKNFTVTGYQMVKNPDTFDMERVGGLIVVSVLCFKHTTEMIEGEVAIKMGFDWFEAVLISW